MKHNNVIICVFVLLFFYACTDEVKDDININEDLPGLNDLQALGGENRVKLSWNVNRKDVQKFVVKQDGSEVAEVSYKGEDSLSIIIDDLQEGENTFTIFLLYSKNEFSIGYKVSTMVYGDRFIETISSRRIKEIVYDDKDVILYWDSPSEKMLESKLSYKNIEQKDEKLIIRRDVVQTTLRDFKFGSVFTYETRYLPEVNAIDTLSTNSKEIGPLDFSNISIKWDKETLKPIASLGGYCRVIQLDDGDLLAAYEVLGKIAVTRSSDGGASWTKSIIIVEEQAGYNFTTPSLIELQSGSVLIAYNPRPVDGDSSDPDPSKNYSIRIIRSDDNGRSWYADKVLYNAGYLFEEGCWEPALVQLPNGEIQLFFSDEKPYPNSDEQNISLLRSYDDGFTWTVSPEIVSFRPEYRDGMPAPIVLPEANEILFSIEDSGDGNFKPYIIRNSIHENWESTVGGESSNRSYALERKLSNTVYAGAPYLVNYKNKLTILSFQSTENRSNVWNLSSMNVAVGDADGRNFRNVTLPFDIPIQKYGLWNSLCVMNDGSIMAVSATNAFHDSEYDQVYSIKGKLQFLIDN